jgi:DNA repair exonuclease SbcCD ATPase subunit
MGKIIVNQVELKNFFSYGNTWQTIDLNEGVNIVLGHDKDKDRSNGAGKTSFLEAIPFALFGQTSKGVALPKIINWKNGKQCEVRLHFEKDGISYILHRGIKPGKLDLTKDGVIVPKLSDKRVFQMELENDLIGMDFKAAQTLLFQNANNMVSIFNTPKADKRKFIEKFFNLEIYSQVNDIVNSKLQKLNEKVSSIEMEVGYKQQRIDELEETINRTTIPDIEKYENDLLVVKKQLEDFLNDNPVDDNKRSELQSEIQDITNEKGNILDEISGLKDEKSKINSQISSLKGEKSTLERRIVEIGDLSDQKVKFNKVKDALENMPDYDEFIEDEENDYDAMNSENVEIVSKKVVNESEQSRIKKELSKWENYKSTDSAICPTCFQEVNYEHIESHIQSEIEGLTDKLADLEEEHKGYIDIIDELKERMSKVSNSITEYKEKKSKKNQLEQHLIKLSGVEEKEVELNDIQKRLSLIDPEILELELSVSKIDDKIKSLSDNFSELDVNLTVKSSELKDYDEIIHNIQILEQKVKSEESIYESQKSIYDRVTSEHQSNVALKAQLQSDLGDYSDNIKKLHSMKDYLDYIKTTLKDENVKQYAISNIIPYLQQQTNHYLSETGHNYYVELDSWLDGTINGYGVGDCDFGNMSGGEGKSIDLALKFAMMDVARRQAGSYLDVLVLDELLDSSIDSFGIEKTFEIVKMKQREDNLKVFVVSHREEVVDFGGDSVYRVTKEDGFSTINIT